MALVEEDGGGSASSPSANSYATVARADTYFSDRNNSDWSGATDTVKAAALIEATDYLTANFRHRWKGLRVNSGQPLDWPRFGVFVEEVYQVQGLAGSLTSNNNLWWEVPSTIVPDEVRNACMELAVRRIESGARLNPDLDRGGMLKRVKAGSVEVEYMDGAPATKTYEQINDMLRPLLNAYGALTKKLVRV